MKNLVGFEVSRPNAHISMPEVRVYPLTSEISGGKPAIKPCRQGSAITVSGVASRDTIHWAHNGSGIIDYSKVRARQQLREMMVVPEKLQSEIIFMVSN